VDGRRFQAARAAVVRVVISGPAGETPVQARLAGLGFVVDPNGYVMTSERLVRGARSIVVELPGGQRLPVTQIGRDPYFEVAVLKVDVRALPYVALGESETLKVGESVVAIGSPGGRESADTLLHVTSTGAATGGDLATDAPIPSQAVGGPLVNSHGHAVGIASASEQPGQRAGGSIGRAVPIDRAKSILRDLQSNMVQKPPRSQPPGSETSSR
jgi:S1-C subfamily serine protease